MKAKSRAGLGFNVAVNDGQKGVELVRVHGNPTRGRHSLQIEINRRLYWDERNFAKRDCFEDQRQAMTGLIAVICDYARGAIS